MAAPNVRITGLVYPYHQALTKMYSTYIYLKLGTIPKKINLDALLSGAEASFKDEKKKSTHAKVSLKRRLKLLKQIKEGKVEKIPSLDFSVVD